MIFNFDLSAIIDLGIRYPKDNDYFSQIWRDIDGLISKKSIIIVNKSEDEFRRGRDKNDDLINFFGRCFYRKDSDISDQQIVKNVKNILEQHSDWIGINQRNLADPWIIAKSMTNNSIIVSDEKSDANDIKLPDVANKFGVKCINLVEFLKVLQSISTEYEISK